MQQYHTLYWATSREEVFIDYHTSYLSKDFLWRLT
jgi:hypothetical protein